MKNRDLWIAGAIAGVLLTSVIVWVIVERGAYDREAKSMKAEQQSKQEAAEIEADAKAQAAATLEWQQFNAGAIQKLDHHWTVRLSDQFDDDHSRTFFWSVAFVDAINGHCGFAYIPKPANPDVGTMIGDMGMYRMTGTLMHDVRHPDALNFWTGMVFGERIDPH